jgi:inosose dehydratase
MLNVQIGHSALTWGVLDNPERLSDTIADCAGIGFKGTETGGFVYDWWEKERPGELKRLLTERGMVMACLFQFGDWVDPDERKALAENGRRWATGVRELGGRVLMLVPGGRRDEPPYGLDDFRLMADVMNENGEIANAAGAIAAVHPHWGTMAESRLEIDLLLDLLDPDKVGFAPDTGQIAKGGTDPLGMIERWVNRVRHVHMKDLSLRWAEMQRAGVPLRSPEGYIELGQGAIDMRALIPMLDGVNYEGWLMAEVDEATRPARDSAQMSWDYIESTLGPLIRQTSRTQ